MWHKHSQSQNFAPSTHGNFYFKLQVTLSYPCWGIQNDGVLEILHLNPVTDHSCSCAISKEGVFRRVEMCQTLYISSSSNQIIKIFTPNTSKVEHCSHIFLPGRHRRHGDDPQKYAASQSRWADIQQYSEGHANQIGEYLLLLSSYFSTLHLQIGFMKRFGYLGEGSANTEALHTEEAITEAITQMQIFGGIHPSGQLDEDTLKVTTTL